MNQQKKALTNVAEAWTMYDGLCVTPAFYGTEDISLGWFNTFADFAAKETHSFFMNRTIGSIGQQYTNKNTVDRVDFAFDAFSLGVRFYAPGVRTLGKLEAGDLLFKDHFSAHWWETELPRHCAIQFKVQQDIVAEGPAMAFSPGYGPVGDGAAFDHENINSIDVENGTVIHEEQHPSVMNMSVTQGVPTLSNRFGFEEPIGIPRTGAIECVLHISEFAREVLTNIGSGNAAGNGPLNYIFIDAMVGNTPTYSEFPTRYGVEVSLMGIRYVQQRAQYHA